MPGDGWGGWYVGTGSYSSGTGKFSGGLTCDPAVYGGCGSEGEYYCGAVASCAYNFGGPKALGGGFVAQAVAMTITNVTQMW